VSRLKLVSARKRWKLQHGFKLKKRNIRNEKKGIFEGNV
jgi:ATP-dependent RNA helicase DDX56/DBP9